MFINGRIDESNLKESLFGNASITRNIVQPVTIDKPKERRNQHDMNTNSLQNRKKVVTSDGWEIQPTQNWTTTRRPPTFGYWKPKPNQEMSSNITLPMNNDPIPETPKAVQPVMPIDHLESTKNAKGADRLRFGGIPEATKSWGETGREKSANPRTSKTPPGTRVQAAVSAER